MAMLSCHIHRHCIKMARKTLEAHKLFCYFLAFEVLALSPCTLSLMEIGPTRGREKGGDVGTLMRKRREHANSGGKNWSGRTRTALRQSRLPPSLMLLGEVACKGGQGRPIPQFNLSISPLPSIFIFSFKLRTEMENNPLHFCSTRKCMIHYFSV